MMEKRRFKQREEVRAILHAMRLELAAQRLAQFHAARPDPVLRFNDLLTQARRDIARPAHR